MTHDMTSPPTVSLGRAILRALGGRCPCCGKGKIFIRYLKLVDTCAICGESLGHIQADDGPAWLTIVVLGHVMGTFILHFSPTSTWPEWVDFVLWPLVALVAALALLPRAKGVFVGAIWHSKSLNPRRQDP